MKSVGINKMGCVPIFLVRWQVKETVLALVASIIFPFLVHLVPPIAGVPLGARILAMFYTPLVALVLFRPHVALICSLLAPSLNHLLTAHPRAEMIPVLTAELILFTAFYFLILRRWPKFWGKALLAYIMSLSCVSLLLRSLDFFINAAVIGWWGIGILLVLDIALSRFGD